MDGNGNLQISVTNFGPIESAEIDLRPLTVFVGPSNTGKSYLATLVYALHEFFIKAIGFPRGGFQYGRVLESDSLVQNMSSEQIGALGDWIDQIAKHTDNLKTSSNLSFPVPDPVRLFTQPVIKDLSELSNSLGQELSRCFGVEDSRNLIRYRCGDEAAIRFRRLNSDGPIGLAYGVTVNSEGSALSVSITNDIPLYARYAFDTAPDDLIGLRDFRHMLDEPRNDRRSIGLAYFIDFIVRLIECSVLSPLNRPAHYLPSDRTGVMHSHRLAVGSLIARAPYAGLQRDDQMPVLSGVLADFLGELTQMGDPQNPMTPLRQLRLERNKGVRKLASRLEKEILGGAVNIHQSPTGYPSFFYQPEGWERELPLMNASSMVSELAPVALYLRHVVRPGDLLIIEEPESHLHPAMQIEFIRRLAAVVNSGVRVMITTHSEWALNELTNLARLSELAPNDRDGIGGADYALSPEQLGMWLLEQNGEEQGSIVKEIPFDEDFGGFHAGYNEFAIGNYNDYAEISRRIGREEA